MSRPPCYSLRVHFASLVKIDDPILSRPRLPQVRDESVLLDSDLARLDEAETKIFNQAIRRNTHLSNSKSTHLNS